MKDRTERILGLPAKRQSWPRTKRGRILYYIFVAIAVLVWLWSLADATRGDEPVFPYAVKGDEPVFSPFSAAVYAYGHLAECHRDNPEDPQHHVEIWDDELEFHVKSSLKIYRPQGGGCFHVNEDLRALSDLYSTTTAVASGFTVTLTLAGTAVAGGATAAATKAATWLVSWWVTESVLEINDLPSTTSIYADINTHNAVYDMGESLL